MKKSLRALAFLGLLLAGLNSWGQTTLATYTFDGSGLTGSTNVTSTSGVNPAMTASVTESYFQGNPTTGMAASFASSGSTKYLELTMTTTGYSNIKVAFDGRGSSAGSIWNVSGDATGGTTMAATGVSLTCGNGSFASLASTALSSTGAYDNKSSVRLRFICGGTSSTMRIDNIVITGTAQATSVTFSSTTSSGTTVNWTDGNGAKRAVFMALASTGSAAPVINTTYTANTSFSSGTQIGSTGWYCIFNGTTHASGVVVSNLAASSTYRVMVCEYDGAAAAEKYNYYASGTGNPANVTTLSAGGPTITGAATTTAFTTTYGTASAAQTFTVGGTNLTANLVATAPTGFEVSADGTTYGGTATFTQSSGTASGTLYIRLKATAAAGSYNSQSVVLSSTSATSQNITTPATGNSVSPKALTITGTTIASKVYDASTTSGTVTAGSLSGFVGSETVTVSAASGAYADANVATGKTATITYTLADGANGGLAANYSLTGTATGDITAKALSITAPTIASKAYNGTTASGTVTTGTLSGFVGTQTVTATATGTYADANVGTGKTATIVYVLANGANGGLAANYSLANGSGTGNITAKALTIGAPTIASKVYDRSTTSGTVTPGALSGFVGTETVVVTSATGVYATATVGTGKTATITYVLGNGTNGGLASNYSLATGSGTGNITAVNLTCATNPTAANKTYDATTTASVSGGSLSGILSPDVVSISTTGTFASANAGTGIAVTILLTGADAANYTVTQPGITANINKANQTITFNALPAKTTADADFAPGATTTSGLTITYSSATTTVATIVSGNIHIVGAGTSVITASQAGDANYNAATSVTQTLTVTSAPVALANYLFTGTTCTNYAATGVAANLTFGDIVPSGITCNTNVATNIFGGSASWGSAFSAAKYLEFTVTITAGYQLSASSLVFDVFRSGAGATNYTVRSSLDSYAADISTGTVSTTQTTKTATLGSPTYDAITSPITFRIYGWGGNSTGDFRLDNIILNGFVDPLATPVINGAATATAFTTTYGTASSAQSFAISGSNLASSITATAPTGFEVSADGTTYGATSTYTQSGGNASGTVFLRLKANAAVGTTIYDAKNVTLTSGVTTVNIITAASGNQVSAKALTVTATAQSKTYGSTLTLGAGQTTFSSVGLANSETIGSVTLASAGAVATAAPGAYNITPSAATGGTFAASNYTITYNTGTLTVNKATPTITVTGSASYAYTGAAIGPNTSSAPAVGGGVAPSGTVTYSYVGTGSTSYGPSATRPTAIGTYTATATIAADANYNTATSAAFAFSITGNANSDIVYNSASSASQNQNIDYTAYQAATITNTLPNNANGSAGVMGFTLRDGGATTDADNNSTTLTDISFNVTNVANIRSAAIFNGTTLVAAVAVNGVSPINFTGLSVACADDQTVALNLRVTFNSAVTDKQKMVFTVGSATALGTGSVFAAANAGGAQSDNVTAAVNRLEVTATKLLFVQGPSNTGAGAAMSPSVTVKACDALGNTDIDYTGSVAITSTGTLSGTSTNSASLSSGVATFSNIIHSAAGTGLTLTASLSPLTSTGASSTFDITSIVYVNNDWRSLTPGTWTSTSGAGTATWERYSGGTWSPATGSSPTGTTNVYIAHDIQIPTAGGSYGGASITILPNASLTWGSSSPWTAKNMHVYGSGVLNINTRFTMDAAGTFEVEDAGVVNYSYAAYSTNNLSSSLWNGTENFHPNSIFNILDFSSASADLLIPAGSDITANAYNGYTACFGNLVFNSGTSGTFTLLSDAFNKNLTHNDLIFKSPVGSSTTSIRLNTTGYTFGVGGNFIMDASLVRSISCLNAVATATINIKKNLINNSSASFTVLNNTGSSSVTINIDSNLTVPNAGTVNMNGASGASTATSIINVKGDVSFGSSATLTSTATSNSAFNFNGTGDGLTAATTQTVDIASTAATRNQYVDFTVKNGAYVQLANQNVDLGKNSSVTVANGGTLDFGFNGSTALNLTSYSTGSNFTSATGSTLKITSPNGCNNTSGVVGNVQTTNAPTYNQTATFWFIGKANQSTGTIFGAGGSADRNIYVKLLDNTITLTPVVPVTIGAGGKVEVQKGIVVNTPAADFIGGSGKLIMTDGIYQNSETASSVPILGNGSVTNYTLTGGAVELNAAADQSLKGGVDYYSLTFSNSGIKTLTSGLPVNSINGLVTVKDAAILDVANNEFSGDAGLTMLNTSRFKMSMLNTTLPQLTGINFPYTLTGGTVELYGTSATQTQSIRGTYGSPSSTIAYNNVDINSTAANVAAGGANVTASAGFNVNGTMNINSPACFQLASTHTISGAGSFNVLTDATFKYGGTIAASGATGNIQTTTRNFATTASYGFVGSLNQTGGTGLPTQMVNMYLDKTSAANTVTLSQSVTLSNSLVFYKGIVVTNANKVTATAATTVTGASATSGWVNGNLEKFVGSALAKDFEIGDAAVYAPVNLSFVSTNNGTGSITASTLGADHSQIATSSISPAASVNRNWTLTNNGVTGFGSYSATLNFVTADIDGGSVGNTASFIAAKYTTGAWSLPTVGTRSSTSTQVTGVTTFGDFQVGEAIIVSPNTWQGDVIGSVNDWFNAGNWSNNVVPNSCSADAVIPTSPSGGNNFPILNASSASVGNITVQDGATIAINSGRTLSVCGNWTGGTTSPSTVTGTGSVILTGSAAQAVSGRTAFTTLHVTKTGGSTATLQANSFIDVTTAVELESGTLATGTGTLTFKSTSLTQVAVLDNFTAGYTGTLTGSIVAERAYASASAGSYSQHYMGSPVSNATLAQFGGGSSSGFVTPTATCSETQLASTSVYGSVFSYDQANGGSCALAGWKVEAGTAAAVPAKGFSVARTGAGTLTVTGNANLNASYTQTGANSNWANSSLQGRPMTSGWLLVSNPYLATLNLTGAPTQSGFTAQIKVWNTTGPFAGTYQDATVIAPFQAFFVQKQTTGGNTYTIDGARRTRSTQTFQQNNNDQQLSITATNTTTTLADITMVAFNSDATDQFDADYDGQKIAGSLGRHTLYTVGANNLWMSKNVLHDIATTSTVTMGFEPEVSGSYTFSFEGLNSFDPTSYITLEDRKLNTFYDVRNGDYNFTADSADQWERFVLHFTPAAQITTTDENCNALGNIIVTQPGTANWNYTITDNNNATIASGMLNETTPINTAAQTGTYVITLVDNNNYTVAKTVTVSGTAPVAAVFTPSVTVAETNQAVSFNSSSVATNYYWDFGDGTTATGQNAIHNYSDTGTYTVTLIVISEGGCSSTTTQTITVNQTATGITTLNNKAAINIWSNENKVYIDFSQMAKTDATIAIYNVLGQELVNEKFARSTIYNKAILNTEAAYVIVKVKNGEVVITKKVFIANK